MFFKLIQKLNYKRNFPYFVCTPLVYGIGAASEHIATAVAYAKRENKKIRIIKTDKLQSLLNYRVCNNSLFDSLVFNEIETRQNLTLRLINFLIQSEFILRRSLAIILKKFLKINIGENFRFALLGSSDLYSEKGTPEYRKINPLSIEGSKINILSKKKDIFYQILSKKGLSKKKFVCLHVRDGEFYKDGDRRPYRNSNINNYIELIKLLIQKDYTVFRLGSRPLSKLHFNDKNFIDYPNSELKSDIMDLCLIKECEFYVGTPSGPLDTAYLFEKPVLVTNLYDLYPSFPRKKNDRGLLRTVIKKDTGQKLDLKEFAQLNIKYHQTEVLIDDLDFVENTSEELYNGMIEYLDLFQDQNQKILKFENNQIKVNEFLKFRLEEIYNEEVVKKNYFKENNWKKNEFLRIIKRFKSCQGTYTNSSIS